MEDVIKNTYNLKDMSYSEQIKRIRADLLVTQTELAEMLGVTFATINRWERGHHEPSIRQKRAIRDLCRHHGIEWEGDNYG